ncbi:MAG: hypothetical protein WBA87_07705 [Microbacterium sp.]
MDTLLRGGRVIDPGTGTDEILDVLIVDDRISAVGVGLSAPAGAAVIDVTGLIVGPGFIDLHSHVLSTAGQRLQAMKGCRRRWSSKPASCRSPRRSRTPPTRADR